MTHGMVSAAQPEAVEAGIDILRAGGNVVDAAIGAALVQTAVDPQMCGIAGMGCLHLYLPARGVHTTIDFHGRSPAAARPDMWQDLIEREADDGWGFILQGRVNEIGYQSIATPMTLRAFDYRADALRHARPGRVAAAGDRVLRAWLPGASACQRVLALSPARRAGRQYRRRHALSGDTEDLHQIQRPSLCRRRTAAQSRHGPHLSPHRQPWRGGFL